MGNSDSGYSKNKEIQCGKQLHLHCKFTWTYTAETALPASSTIFLFVEP